MISFTIMAVVLWAVLVLVMGSMITSPWIVIGFMWVGLFIDEYFHMKWKYIGLKDKNGKRVHEGDRILFESDSELGDIEGVVRFANASFYIETDTAAYYRWTDYTILRVL